MTTPSITLTADSADTRAVLADRPGDRCVWIGSFAELEQLRHSGDVHVTAAASRSGDLDAALALLRHTMSPHARVWVEHS